MRIIDKNTDFYDFYQSMYPDSAFTFDRTDSYLLSKDDVCAYLYTSRYTEEGDIRYLLLQVCNTFWLFLATITKIQQGSVKDFSVDLLATWKNYSKPRCLVKLDVISFSWEVDRALSKRGRSWRIEYDKSDVIENIGILVSAIDLNNHRVERSFDRKRVRTSGGELVDKHLPLLKASGLSSLIDPLDIYLAFEEYFSLEKTATERTESVGITDKERIENHGFDTKTSFRGKV